MNSDSTERRLAAVLSADAVGYSRLMAEDEAATIRALTSYRSEITALVEKNRGRVVDAPGDNLLAEFPSALEAVTCAAAVQETLADRNASVPAESKMEFRIGIHLGDVVAEGPRIYGDGINIAARLEALAEPGGICISALVHSQVHNKVDFTFEDLGEQELKNIPLPVRAYGVRGGGIGDPQVGRVRGRGRVGGRLRKAGLATVSLLLVLAAALWLSWPRPLGWMLDISGLAGPPMDPALPDGPSIVVLPFTNMSSDPEQEYFSDGITEDLTTDLSRSPQLFVISRNSAFTYKGQAVKVEEVGRELGVRYVLEGSVQKAGDRVRVTAQLIDAHTGFHVWSDRYDRDLVDILLLQSDIAQQILEAVGVQIEWAERDRAGRMRLEDLRNYELVNRAFFHFLKFNRRDNAEARRLFESAIEGVEHPSSVAGLGQTYAIEYMFGWSLDPTLMDRAEELAGRAIGLDASRSDGHFLQALVHLSREESPEAVAAARRAHQALPNADHTNAILGGALLQNGEYVEGLQMVKRSLRLNPRAPSQNWLFMAFANLAAGRYNQGVDLLERVRVAGPENLIARIALAMVYEASEEKGGWDHHVEATVVVKEVLEVNPALTAEQAMRLLPIGDAVLTAPDRTAIVGYLRRAGFP